MTHVRWDGEVVGLAYAGREFVETSGWIRPQFIYKLGMDDQLIKFSKTLRRDLCVERLLSWRSMEIASPRH
jgi:hypothetical protein